MVQATLKLQANLAQCSDQAPLLPHSPRPRRQAGSGHALALAAKRHLRQLVLMLAQRTGLAPQQHTQLQQCDFCAVADAALGACSAAQAKDAIPFGKMWHASDLRNTLQQFMQIG